MDNEVDPNSEPSAIIAIYIDIIKIKPTTTSILNSKQSTSVFFSLTCTLNVIHKWIQLDNQSTSLTKKTEENYVLYTYILKCTLMQEKCTLINKNNF